MPFYSMLPFTIIVPWKSGDPIREEHFHNMLACMPPNDGTHVSDPVVYELIIVEQVTNLNKVEAQQRIRSIMPKELLTSKTAELVNYQYIQCVRKEGLPFNKSWLMNVGARNARYDTIVFMDADSLFGADYFRQIKSFFLARDVKKKLAVLWNYLILLPGPSNYPSRHVRPDMIRTLGGIWGTSKAWFFGEFGGMNENFEGYGGEDNEGYERGCKVLNIPHLLFLTYPLAHQYHDWAEPAKHAVNFFELGRDNWQAITNKLIAAKLGNPEGPTFINVEDLK